MSTSTSSSFNPLKIALTATGVIAAATVSYAVYFDYRRRNDAVFRKNILKEYKKVDKKVKHAQEQGKEQIQAALKRAIALANAEPVPVTAEGKEQFFMEQVALAEQLAARSPEFYVAAAISFYKALKVYPAPQELIMIYQKSLPPAVFDLVMELISLEIHAASSSSSSSRTTGSSSQQIQEEPILQELSEAEVDEKKKRSQQVDEDDEEEEEIKVGTTTTTTAAAASSSDDKPKTTEEEEEESGAGGAAAPSSTTGSDSSPSSGSFVHVETDNNTNSNEVVGDVEEEKESTPAVVATTSSEDPPEEPIVAA